MNKSDTIKYSLSLANTFEDRPLVEELIKQSYELTKNNIHKRKINKSGKYF